MTERRLTDIKDMAGNWIHYTLDTAGNPTDETVNDACGALAGLLQIETAQKNSQLTCL